MIYKKINLGCGSYFHPSWINIDFSASSPEIIIHDLTKGIPFPDAQFHACYSSHLIEHLFPQDAKFFLQECYRILEQQGIIRVVVPDLEGIVRLYLQSLTDAELGKPMAHLNHKWMTLELYDQIVRSYTGGEIGEYLSQPHIPNQDFVRSRFGLELDNYFNSQMLNAQKSFLDKIKSQTPARLFQKSRNYVAIYLVNLIAGERAMKAFQEGLFRQSGEIHRWMYDRFSLSRLLSECGFVDIKVCQADESRIPDFNTYSLDIIDGKVRKPDSLFIEARKPL